jgi:phosphomannomutase
MIPEHLRRAAAAWLADDPDPETREELRSLLEREDGAALAERFEGKLEFGTAGLRGVIGAGPSRFNRAVVLRATAGLCDYLRRTVPGAAERGVLIGFDGRRKSREAARDAAEVVAGAGLRTLVFDDVVPTPLLAFAAKDAGAAAGVMVTASHNPPEYNGYKVYWENGAQIIPPHDTGIGAAIDAVDRIASLRRAPDRVPVGADVERRYLNGVRGLLVHPEVPRDVVVAYTALHGVGERLARRALAEAGFSRVASVAEQAEPDARFPTVAFPNPEEKGAMDLVLALAAREGADVVLANDPDADRLAVAGRDRGGAYVMLTGNDIGALLAHYLLSEGPGGDRLVINSVVSSPMLGDIARAHGARFAQTLTGFKWIANRAMALERDHGTRFVMGFEEALGYSVGTLVRDKDGISAAVVMAEMAAWSKAQGRTLLEERERAWRRYGLWVSRQVSMTLPGREGALGIRRLMQLARERPFARLGGAEVAAVQDFERGTRTPRGGGPEPLDFPASDVLAFELAGGHRVMMRPSGTEPKIKFYFDVREEVGEAERVADARARGEGRLDTMVTDFRAQVRELAPGLG